MPNVLKVTLFAVAMMVAASGSSRAQTIAPSPATEVAPKASFVPSSSPSSADTDALFAAPRASLFEPSSLSLLDTDVLPAQQPAPVPPTPRHTGIKAMTKHFVTNFKYLPSMENLYWAAGGGGLALAVHPADDEVNHAMVNSDFAHNFFKVGEVLGELPTLLGSAATVYAVGRIKDKPKVSHLGMDLIEALVMSEALTQTLKYTTMRERPDGSGKNSFPSGHAADTFAFATALERHLNWRYAVPAYIFSSYVAISRLPANRHWLSDTVFGATVGIIAGRTVTSHEAERPYPVAVTIIPGGVAVMYTRNNH
jgi:membrane-associated phospholipid phosphatase